MRQERLADTVKVRIAESIIVTVSPAFSRRRYGGETAAFSRRRYGGETAALRSRSERRRRQPVALQVFNPSRVQSRPATVASPVGLPVGGNPIQYVIEKAFAHHDLDWRCVTFEVGPMDLEDAVRGLRAMGFCGAYCAAPHQRAVAGLLDRTTDAARAIDAVNVVLCEENTLLGENTDGKGIIARSAASSIRQASGLSCWVPAPSAVRRPSNWPPPEWPG